MLNYQELEEKAKQNKMFTHSRVASQKRRRKNLLQRFKKREFYLIDAIDTPIK